jgi:hypothetical protein
MFLFFFLHDVFNQNKWTVNNYRRNVDLTAGSFRESETRIDDVELIDFLML